MMKECNTFNTYDGNKYTIEFSSNKYRIFYIEDQYGHKSKIMISEKDSLGKAQTLAKQLMQSYNRGFGWGSY